MVQITDNNSQSVLETTLKACQLGKLFSLTSVSLSGHLTYGLINFFKAGWLSSRFGTYPSGHSPRFPWGKGIGQCLSFCIRALKSDVFNYLPDLAFSLNKTLTKYQAHVSAVPTTESALLLVCFM